MREWLKGDIYIICLCSVLFVNEPAIAVAEISPRPENFTQPLSLSRGKIFPTSQSGLVLPKTVACKLSVEEWGWKKGDCEAVDRFIIGDPEGIDSFLVYKPNSDGFVKLDDWNEDVDDSINSLWNSFKQSCREQSRQLNQQIVPVQWLIYPTLVREKSFMYYAILLDWNGERTINAKASLFDREGFIEFNFVPEDPSISKIELRRLIELALSSYKPEAGSRYAEFKSGDKVAAVGALGVLATLIGVKYGKTALAALSVLIIAFAKKLWFLILVVPLAIFKALFGKRKTEISTKDFSG